MAELSSETQRSRRAEAISRKWGDRLDDFRLPCPLCSGNLLFQGVNRAEVYEFAEDEPGVVNYLDVLPMSFVCDRCGYNAEFDSDLFNPSYLAELQGADAERVAELATGDYRVLVPLTGEERSDTVLELASAIAQERFGEIIALNIGTHELQRFEDDVAAYEPKLDHHVLIRPQAMPLPDPGESIVSVSSRQHAELVMIPWRQSSQGYDIMQAILEPILDETICDVAVVQDRGLKQVRRVLLIADGGPHSAAAAPLALDLARAYDAELHLLTVIGPGETDEIAREYQHNALVKTRLRNDERIYERILTSKFPIATLLDEAGKYDVVLIGAAPRSWFGQIQRDSLPGKIARNCNATTVIVRGRQNLFTSWAQGLTERLGGWWRQRRRAKP